MDRIKAPDREPRQSDTFRSYLAKETKPLPEALRAPSTIDLATVNVPIARYISEEFADDEYEHVWSRVWQMACRLEDIPEIGDRIRYDIGHRSAVVVRVSPTEVKAFVNACLHRGRLLCEGMESGKELRCRFHGWTFGLDGRLNAVLDWDDFPHVKRSENTLPEVNVGLWGGFVFLNFADDPPPLLDQLEVIPDHFRDWHFDKRVKTVHVRKHLRCNWKVAIEAFIEGYHVIGTHPQLTPYAGEFEYRQFGRHVNLMLGLTGVPHPKYRDGLTETDIFTAMNRDFPYGAGGEVPEGKTARDIAFETMTATFKAMIGKDISELSPNAVDYEILDMFQYFIFPNLFVFGGFQSPIVYRILPGPNCDTCTMEIIIMPISADGQDHGRIEPIDLGFDQRWSDCPALGDSALVFDQDTSNVEAVQAGMRASVRSHTQLSLYQESGIRLLHDTLSHYIGGGVAA